MKKLLSLFFLFISVCNAQTIEVIVSASAGGPNDTVTRKVVEKLEEKTDLKFVISNKPGAAHTIAYSYVEINNKPILIVETPEIETYKVYSQVKEIYNFGNFSNVVFVSKNSGIKNLDDLISLSKKRQINFGHGGFGSYSHMAMKKMCEKTLSCLDVPFKSAAEGMLALLSNTIDAYAIVSYGNSAFSSNEKYIPIYNVKLGDEKSWYKMFGKNISDKDAKIIISALNSIDRKFFVDLGFDK